MKKKSHFYNDYHKLNKNRKFFRSISEYNFTYFLTIKLLKRVKTFFKDKKISILDLGCGVGAVDFFLAKEGHKIHGVDISSEAISIASSYKELAKVDNIIFEIGDVTKFNKNNFDLVICSEVIEHVQDDRLLLKVINKSLKKDGYLLLTTPSENAPLFRLGLLKSFDEKVGHLRRYNINNLEKMIIEAGFEVIYIEKNESILRNSLYTFPYIGYLIKLFRFSLFVKMFHHFDNILVLLLGESNLAFIARKT